MPPRPFAPATTPAVASAPAVRVAAAEKPSTDRHPVQPAGPSRAGGRLGIVDLMTASPPTPATPADWLAFRRRLVGWLERRVRNPADAEDLAQEILARAAARLDTLRDSDRLVPWLDAMARHALVDHYRRDGRAPETVPLDPDRHDSPVPTDPPGDRRHLTGCLRPLLESLPPRYREVVRRVDLNGERQVDVASDLGLGISALKSRVQRGRVMLRDRFSDCCGAVERDAAGRVVGFRDGPAAAARVLVPLRSRRSYR